MSPPSSTLKTLVLERRALTKVLGDEERLKMELTAP